MAEGPPALHDSDDVAEDPIFHDHPTPRMSGFQSYLSCQIVRAHGDFFGTIFTIDTEPTKRASRGVLSSLPLFARSSRPELEGGRRLPASGTLPRFPRSNRQRTENNIGKSAMLIHLIIVLIVVGVLLWLVNNYIPMDGKIKQILNIVVVIAVIIYLLRAFGIV